MTKGGAIVNVKWNHYSTMYKMENKQQHVFIKTNLWYFKIIIIINYTFKATKRPISKGTSNMPKILHRTFISYHRYFPISISYHRYFPTSVSCHRYFPTSDYRCHTLQQAREENLLLTKRHKVFLNNAAATKWKSFTLSQAVTQTVQCQRLRREKESVHQSDDSWCLTSNQMSGWHFLPPPPPRN